MLWFINWSTVSETCQHRQFLPTAVNDKHQFKKSDLLYRFRYDDGTFRIKYEGSDLLARVSQHPTVLGSSVLCTVLLLLPRA